MYRPARLYAEPSSYPSFCSAVAIVSPSRVVPLPSGVDHPFFTFGIFLWFVSSN
jgi:hypothetical protein